MYIRKEVISVVRLLPSVCWMGLIFYVSAIPNLEFQGDLSAYDFFLRKFAHITEYAILTVLLWWGSSQDISHRKLVIAIVVGGLYAISDEVHQSFVDTRDGKLFDIGIDAIGILVAGILIQYRYGVRIKKS